jgi:hypothetical protein
MKDGSERPARSVGAGGIRNEESLENLVRSALGNPNKASEAFVFTMRFPNNLRCCGKNGVKTND